MGVAVMDEFVYSSLSHYFTALCKSGYYKQTDVEKLLILIFYRNFALNDYRGYISEEDYQYIDKALNCLYESNCLIPYPDFMRNGTLELGKVSELAHRMKEIENTKVVKVKEDVMVIDDIHIPESVEE